MKKDRLNSNFKEKYEQPKVKIVKPMLNNPFTTTYTVATSHKK